MREILIKRIFHDDKATLGVLYLEHAPALVVLERPWLDNKREVSCIPQGSYNCKRLKHPRFGDTIHILAVPDRDGILCHSGNRVEDSKGCPMFGMSFDTRNDQRMIVDSGFAMKRFRDFMGNEQDFKLRIMYA